MHTLAYTKQTSSQPSKTLKLASFEYNLQWQSSYGYTTICLILG